MNVGRIKRDLGGKSLSHSDTTPYAAFQSGDDGADPAPLPYGVAVLLAIAQQQHR